MYTYFSLTRINSLSKSLLPEQSNKKRLIKVSEKRKNYVIEEFAPPARNPQKQLKRLNQGSFVVNWH